jgi:alpha-tubulin suppressor-like RCC1 family protein
VLPRPTNNAKWKDFTASCGSAWAWTEDSDGSKAYSIGKNDYSQLGDGTTTNRTTWVPVLKVDNTQLGGVKLIKWTTDQNGSGTAYFVLNNGDLYTCGYNGYGECGVGNTTTQTKAVFVMSNVRDVAPTNGTAGAVSAVKTDGTLWAWGYNGSGEVGDGTNVTPRSSPVQLRENGTSGNFITGVKSIHGGMGNWDGGLYFIKEDGSVYVTGYYGNYVSPFGLGFNGSVNTYTKIPISEAMENIYLNYWNDGTYQLPQTFYLARSGRLYSCGWSGYNALGAPGVGNTNTLVQVLLGQ